MLELLLLPGKMLRLVDGPLADDYIRLFVQDWAHQFLNVGAAVLVVCVGVDDDISAKVQAGVQSGHEAVGQALVLFEVHHMVEAQFPRDFHGPVLAAVVDDEILDLVDPVNVPGQVMVGDAKRLFLVIAWDLNDEFQI